MSSNWIVAPRVRGCLVSNAMTRIVLIVIAALTISCSGGGSESPTSPTPSPAPAPSPTPAPAPANDGVASVQITATSSNPRVRDTTIIGATPVDPGGVAVLGIPCTFASDNAAVLALTPDGPGARGVGVSAGTAVVTATCGSKANTVTITVRSLQVTFTVTKAGTGNGSLFLNPPGGTYDSGTSVTATATALAGSTFSGWSGACAGAQATCTLTLTSDQSATGTFLLGRERFVGATIPNTSMGNAVDGSCTYAISTTGGNFSAQIETNASGAISGTTTGTINVGIAVTSGSTCSGNSYSSALTGAVTGNNSGLTAVASRTRTSGAVDRLTFTGTRSGTTMTGSLKILVTTVDQNGRQYPFEKTISNYTLTTQ